MPADTENKDIPYISQAMDIFVSTVVVFPMTRVHFYGDPQHPAIAQYAIKIQSKYFRLRATGLMSDHEAVLYSVNVKAPITQSIAERTIFLYHKGNIDAIRKDMSDLCNTFMSSDPYTRTVEENWQLFKTCIQDSVNQYVPQKTH